MSQENSTIKVQTQVPLRGLSTFKIGGNASHLFVLEDKGDLRDVVTFANENNLPVFILGGGSNILFADSGVDALVIKILNKGISFNKPDHFAILGASTEILADDTRAGLLNKEMAPPSLPYASHSRDSDHEVFSAINKLGDTEVLVKVEAGEGWDDFVAWTVENGFYGLENLSAIPGTVGASPVQNIGAYGVEAKDSIESVEVFDINTLEFKTLTNSECGFRYRHSIFKTKEGGGLIVVGVTFKLSTKPIVNISYKDLLNYFKDNTNPTPVEVRNAVAEIRKGKFPDLNVYGTAGSFFKNIICNEGDIQDLKTEYPDMPVYCAGEGMVKISTAFVLDKICGLKGFRKGNVGLYENQSLVVVNYRDASSDEVREFISKIKSIVEEKTGISIEEEVILA